MKQSKLLKDYPEALKDWDYDLNTNVLTPEFLFAQSKKKYYWKCPQGHPSYLRSLGHKTSRLTGCPICSNKKVVAGINDLATVLPSLAEEWDYERNILKPSEVTKGSPKKVWWKCPNGHGSYPSRIYNRVNGSGCPICNTMFQTSFPEQAVFFYLKKVFPDAINKCRNIFGSRMELDIYIPSISIAIEYDGVAWHNNAVSKEREHNKYLLCKEHNIFLYRIKEEISDALNADKTFVISKSQYENSKELTDVISTIIKERTNIENPDIDIDRDINEILSYKIIKYEDSLACFFPNLVKEWHPTLNGDLKPENVLPGTTLKVWWKCSKGHEWKAPVNNRAKGSGCDICARKQRMQTRHKTQLSTRELLINCKCVADWDYSKNKLGPENYTKGSGEKVWWKCHICGHEWKNQICDRTRDYKNGCPACSNRIVVPGKNDLFTTNPELIKEWNYQLNGDLKPSNVAQWSHSKVWWTCNKCGYSYQATPSNRVLGKGCGCCAGRVVVPGINDLATTRPDIAIDWHPTKNGSLKPIDVTKGRRDMIWWKCHVCGHEWQDTLNHRNRGRGCSICRKMNKKQK